MVYRREKKTKRFAPKAVQNRVHLYMLQVFFIKAIILYYTIFTILYFVVTCCMYTYS